MIWAEAEGCRVVDADGREYLDLSGGFGVAALGHRNPLITDAWAPIAEATAAASMSPIRGPLVTTRMWIEAIRPRS